jgi:hypothetical protein
MFSSTIFFDETKADIFATFTKQDIELLKAEDWFLSGDV